MHRMRSRGVLASRFRHRCQTGTIDTSFAAKLRRTRSRAIHGSPWSRTNNGTLLNTISKPKCLTKTDCEMQNRILFIQISTKSMIKKKKKKIARTHLSIYEKSASMFSVCLLRHKRKQQLRHLMVAAAGSRPKRISGASQLLHPE